ncbi:hypothetical protein [Flavisphingomonas formosensis]|uniref:hypothetical protein n=1 Tax=Flavisphingomonas formosensis TaxID=861534 RepID=UPI0012F7FC04|nr:hypothetical protein [Sphingomonas formosensis]
MIRHGICKRLLLVLAALGSMSAVTEMAYAHKPLKSKELVFDKAKGYILVRLGPAVGSTGSAAVVGFTRLDPYTGKIMGDGVLNGLSSKEYNAAAAGGGNLLSTDGKTSLYLIPVNPGRWIITGTGVTVYSLGTYGFDVKAGETVDIGTILTGREDGKSAIPEIAAAKLSEDLVHFGTLMNIVMTDALLLRPPGDADPIPAELAAFNVRKAELIPDIRFDNVYHSLVGRVLGLPPMQHNPPLAAATFPSESK